MTILPSPIPHPLDFSPWDLPGWAYEALEWVVGFDWPEGDEKAVWDVADQWYELVSAMAAPREDAADAAARFVAAYGGSGTTIDSFIAAWKAVADGDEAPLNALVAFAAEMGEIVDECAQDIEAAKLEAWIELGIFVIELIGLAVTVALTLGAASPAAAGIIAATRIAIQQIFKRLVAQLSRKAVKQSLKEAGQRAAKDLLTRKGLTSFGKRALREGAEEAREEALTNLAVQGYQTAVGHSDGIDLAELGRSTLAGAAGGVSAHGASIGAGHRSGIVRGATAEVFGEVGGAAAMGDLPGFSDLAKAGTSGAAGSAIGNTRHSFQEMGASLDAGNGLSLNDLPADAPSSSPSGTDVSSTFSGLPSGSPVADPETSSAVSPTLPPLVPSPAELSANASAAESHTGDHSASRSSVHSPAATDAATPVSQTGTHQVIVAPLSSDVTLSSAAPLAEAPAHGGASSGAQSPSPAPSAVNTPAAVSTPTAVNTAPTGAAVAPTAPIGAAPAPGTATSPSPTAPGPASTTGPTSFTSSHPNVSLPGSSPTAAAPPALTVGTTKNEPGLSAPPHSSVAAPAQSGTVHQRPPQTTPPRHVAGNSGLPLPGGAHAVPHLIHRTPEQARHEQEYFDQYDRNKQAVENDLRAKAAAQFDAAIQHAQNEQRRARRGAFRATLALNFTQRDHHRRREIVHQRRENYARTQQALSARTPLADINLIRSPYYGAANTEYAYLTRSDLPVYGSDRSALTGGGSPANTRTSRPYGRPGGLREPLRLHQADLELAVPRDRNNMPVRTPDPRGPFLRLINDGGPSADPTRGFNCLDCSLSFYETYVHGRPTVSAPRTVDGYRFGGFDMHGGESGGPDRAEIATGSTFTAVTPHDPNKPPAAVKADIDRGFEKIIDTLQRGGHGSTAIIINVWEGGDSHAWNAVNHHGSVLFLDPQSGEYADPANFVPGPAKFPTLYGHTGVQDLSNVVALHTLMVDGQGSPMAVANTPHTGYNQGTTPIPPSPPPLWQQQVAPPQPPTPPPPVTPSPPAPSPAPPVHPHPPGPQIHTARPPVPAPRPESDPLIAAPRVDGCGRTSSAETSSRREPAPSREALDPLAVLDPVAVRPAVEPDSPAAWKPGDDPRRAATAMEDGSAAE